jgi:WD40 repeat protein
MGVVYRARHVRLGRVVALKMLLGGFFAGHAERLRFRTEAAAIARLQHPNIVQLYEVGEHDPGSGATRPYFTLEFVDGDNLNDRLAGRPLATRQAAAWLELLARAVHYAHQQGVVHRDLKPSNVLLTRAGEPKLCDFGVAKLMAGSDLRTLSGLLVGTPEYMAPEQAVENGAVGPATDVYALGAVLYAMLTGHPPFRGATTFHTLFQVQVQEPVPPTHSQPSVPRDLETICLKCLEKAPRRRYPSAEALAEDLRRFLAGRPISARPVGLLERTWKWARRRPAVAGLSATVLVVTVLGFTGMVWQWRNAVAGRDTARRQWYRANMAAAAAALRMHNSPAARRILDTAPEEFRQWEWHHFYSQLDQASRVLTGHQGPVLGVAFSPDGGRLVSISHDGTVRLWEAATGREIAVGREHGGSVLVVVVSQDGSRLASGGDDGTVRLWDAHSGAPLGVCRGHAGPVRALAFSPDGRRLVTAAMPEDDQCRLWDAATGTLIAVLPAQAANQGLTFSPDGARIVCCRNEVVSVLDAITGREILAPRTAGAAVSCCAVSPDGWRLVTGADHPQNAVRLWDLHRGELLAVMTGHRNRVTSVAFSPDGTRIASASQDQTVRVWEAAGGKPVAVLQGHTSHAIQVLFSPDGTRVVSASNDGTVRLWDPAGGEPISVLQGHADSVQACAYSPDGAWLASASADHTVRLWDTSLVERNGVLRGHESYVYDVAFSPDGVHIGSAAWDNSARFWDVVTGRQTALLQDPGRHDPAWRRSDRDPVPRDPGAFLLALAFSPDGDELVTGSRDSQVRFWDVKAGSLRRTVSLPGRGVNSLAFSPDGRRVAAALGNIVRGLKSDCSVRLLDARSGETLRTLAGHTDGVLAVRFAPDGRRLVSASFDKTVRVWDAATGEMLAGLTGHADTVYAVAFSPDGRLFASASHDRTVRLWDAHTLQPLDTLPHASIVYAVAFSPDGTRLGAGCEDNTIRLWDVAARHEVAELRGHTAYVHALAFAPDGTRLVSASGDFTIRVWDTLPPRQRSGTARR